MKQILIIAIVALALSGCASGTDVINQKVEQTVAAIPTQTPYPTYPPLPIATPILLTATLVPTVTLANNPVGIIGVAKNYLGSIEQKGVTVEICRVIVADATSYPDDWAREGDFIDAKSLVELILKITNNTDMKIGFLGATYGIAAINGEQINFSDYFIRMHSLLKKVT